MSVSISVLVPVYKVEPYLRRCIDSVLEQDFQDWELILVDDGSPDNCPAICDEYAERDKRIRVIHKPNGGLVSARLAGFQNARGTYLVFLDSDDWLLPGALSVLHTAIEKGYDMVRACSRRVLENGSYTIERGRFHSGKLAGNQCYMEKTIRADLSTYLWGAIYKKELFTEEIFKSILHISIGEDWMTNIGAGRRVEKALCIDDVVYCYFINSQSMMQEKVCSYAYAMHVKRILEQITAHSSEEIKELVKYNRVAAMIKCFFVPELKFDWQIYKDVLNVVRREKEGNEIKHWIDSKFLLLIRRPLLYYIYSRLYCLAFRFLKLKGKRRKVI